jgi:hypothetical protein
LGVFTLPLELDADGAGVGFGDGGESGVGAAGAFDIWRARKRRKASAWTASCSVSGLFGS